jgi:hypothetical protein
MRPGGSYPEAFARSRTRETADELALQVGPLLAALLGMMARRAAPAPCACC